MTTVTFNSGIQVPTLQEIMTSMQEDMQAIYGNDLDFSPNTPDGQRIAIVAQAISDLYQGLVSVYNSFDPNTAVGFDLDRIATLTGLTRREGETDAEFRTRRNDLLYNNSQFTTARAANLLSRIDGIDDVVIVQPETANTFIGTERINPGEIVMYIHGVNPLPPEARNALTLRVAALKPAGIVLKNLGTANTQSWSVGIESGERPLNLSVFWEQSVERNLPLLITVRPTEQGITLNEFEAVLNDGDFFSGQRNKLNQTIYRADVESYVSSRLPRGIALIDVEVGDSGGLSETGGPGEVYTSFSLSVIQEPFRG